MKIVKIVISKSTKVDDLLLHSIISREKGKIDVKNKKTELYDAIEYKKIIIQRN